MSNPQLRFRVVRKQSVESVMQTTVNTVGLAWVPPGEPDPTGLGQASFNVEVSDEDYASLELGVTYESTIFCDPQP